MNEAIPSQPYLTIAIPTFNRAACLEACLESIVTQFPLNKSVEILISDNASTDSTPEIAQNYTSKYPFVKYRRNSINIGADLNIGHLLQSATGKFIKLQGDDDFFNPGTLSPLLEVLSQNEDCGLFFINVLNNSGVVQRGEGSASYLAATSIYSGFITSLVFCKEDLSAIEPFYLFILSKYNQIYLQYAVLERNPRFCLMNNSMFNYAGMPTESFSFGEVNISNYQEILRHFIGRGLSQADYDLEKKNYLFHFLIPRVTRITRGQMSGDIQRFRKIYHQHYKDESYYEEGLALINEVLPPDES